MLELYKKLEGSAALLFHSMSAEQYYMEGGRGIEMLLLLASTFNPMDDEAVHNLIQKLHETTLFDSQDLSVYFDTISDINSQLSWVGQSFPSAYLVQIAITQLSKSRFQKDIASLQLFHTAAKTCFASLEEIKLGLIRLD